MGGGRGGVTFWGGVVTLWGGGDSAAETEDDELSAADAAEEEVHHDTSVTAFAGYQGRGGVSRSTGGEGEPGCAVVKYSGVNIIKHLRSKSGTSFFDHSVEVSMAPGYYKEGGEGEEEVTAWGTEVRMPLNQGARTKISNFTN